MPASYHRYAAFPGMPADSITTSTGLSAIGRFFADRRLGGG